MFCFHRKLGFVIAIGVVSVMSFLVLSSCSVGLKADEIVDGNSQTTLEPAEVFATYWASSRDGKFDELAKNYSKPPDVFWECYSMTAEECAEEKKQLAIRRITATQTNTNSSEIEIVSMDEGFDNFIVRDTFPKEIHARAWTSYSVDRSIVDGDRARLQITLLDNGHEGKREVLLYRFSEEWKIFEIAYQGRHVSFVPFDYQ